MFNNSEIGIRLQKIRTSLNLSQKEFAKELEITQSTISNYEKGHRKPSKVIIKNLCIRFNINKSYLTSGKGTMFNMPNANKEHIFNKFCEAYNIDKISQTMLLEYITMPDYERKVIIKYIDKVTKSINNNEF